MQHLKNRFLLPVLLFLFLGHAAVNIFMAQNHPKFFLHDDGDEYLAGAVSFAGSGRFMTGPVRYYEALRDHDIPEAYRPVLPAFLAALPTLLTGDPMTGAALIQALAAMFLAWASFRIAGRLAGQTAGWCAVLLVTFHPLILTFSLRFSSELLFILALALFILAFLELKEPWNALGAGCAAGFASGVRPTALLLLPAFAVFLMSVFFLRCASCDTQRSGKNALKSFVCFAAAFLLTAAPWCVRNAVNYGTWNPSGCLGGFNLFVGNNRDNAAAYRAPDGKTFLHFQGAGWDRALAFAKALPENMPPPDQDRAFRKAAMEEIRAMGPAEFCRMTAAKAWHFIRPWPLPGAHSVTVFFAVGLFELLLFAAGAAGIVLLRRERAFLLLLLMIFCVGWAAHSFVHLQMRHRIPFLDFPLILTASAAIAEAVTRFRRKSA